MVMMDNDTFAAAWDSTVQFINASTGQVTATIEQAHEGPISYMQFAGSKMKAGGCLLCLHSAADMNFRSDQAVINAFCR